MAATLACLAGTAVYRLQELGFFRGQSLEPRATPFGDSEGICLVHGDEQTPPFYLLPRHGQGRYRRSAGFVNARANLYALKDLGVQCVLSWTAAGAVSHNFSVGDVVIVGDLIDRTTRRPGTFFQDSPMGGLRQFPVFCPYLVEGMDRCLRQMGAPLRPKATLAVTEGPRLETPAEVRALTAGGAELVAHNLAPDAFLAKELELCFAALAYVVNYAETGSPYRPFSTSDLFGGLAVPTERDRIDNAVRLVGRLVGQLSGYVAQNPSACHCGQTMRHEVRKYNLPEDWRQWFSPMP